MDTLKLKYIIFTQKKNQSNYSGNTEKRRIKKGQINDNTN
jgi:hypothetical protein